MIPRIVLAFATVLVPLVLPSALAIGEEAFAAADEALALAGSVHASAVATVAPLLPPEPSQEEAAREREEADRAAPPEEPQPAREPGQAPPAQGGLVSGVAPAARRLVAIPVVDLGAAPRLDLDAIGALSLAPLAPADPAPSMRAAPLAATAPAAPSDAPAEAAPLAAAPLALAATVAATAAAPAAAGALWERARRLVWLGLLYSRIAKERVLDHVSRDALLHAIHARPGLSVADLAQQTDVPRNTVTYHLRVLEREGLVSSMRNGRNRLFFAPGALPRAGLDAPAPREQAVAAYATLRHETTLAIAREIGANPGVDQKALCERVGLSPSLAHWHADRLVASGLVDKRREGRCVRYYPGASFAMVHARVA